MQYNIGRKRKHERANRVILCATLFAYQNFVELILAGYGSRSIHFRGFHLLFGNGVWKGVEREGSAKTTEGSTSVEKGGEKKEPDASYARFSLKI
jgi:hypothetical protein